MKDVKKTHPNKNRSHNIQRSPQVVKKKRRRRKNLTLYYLVIFIFITSSLVVLSLTVFFKIEKISIQGTSAYSQNDIIANSGIKIGKNLFLTDFKIAEQNILKNMVNIDNVKISRKLPSEVVITVKPSEPSYVLEKDGVYYAVSKNGKIMGNTQTPPENGLVVVKGYDPEKLEINTMLKSKDPQKEKIVNDVFSTLDSIKFTGFNEIDISDRLNIKLKYDNRINIELGSSQDLEYKLNFVKKTFEEKKVPEKFQGKIIMHGKNEASIIRQ